MHQQSADCAIQQAVSAAPRAGHFRFWNLEFGFWIFGVARPPPWLVAGWVSNVGRSVTPRIRPQAKIAGISDFGIWNLDFGFLAWRARLLGWSPVEYRMSDGL
jgi:hypothetical protein